MQSSCISRGGGGATRESSHYYPTLFHPLSELCDDDSGTGENTGREGVKLGEKGWDVGGMEVFSVGVGGVG